VDTNESYYLKHYAEYIEALTDAPKIGNEVIACAMLGQAIGKTPLQITPKPLYPNIWCNILGESTWTRKTASEELAEQILPDEIVRLSSIFTPEGLLADLEVSAQGIIFRDEVAGLLDESESKKYMSGIKEIMMQIYNCPPRISKRLSGKQVKIDDPFVSFIGFTTLERFQQVGASAIDWFTGFNSRFLIVPVEPGILRARRPSTASDESFASTLTEKLTQVYSYFHRNKCEFTFTKNACNRIFGWTMRHKREADKQEDTELRRVQSSIIGKAEEYLHKFAAIFEVDKSFSSLARLALQNTASTAVEIPVSMCSIVKAMMFIDNLLNMLNAKLLNLLNIDSGASWLSRSLAKLSKRFDDCGTDILARSSITPYMHMDKQHFDILRDTAVDYGMIEISRNGKTENLKRLKKWEEINAARGS
jgi:hypothetical protein